MKSHRLGLTKKDIVGWKYRTKQVTISVEEIGDKVWVRITPHGKSYLPSFEEKIVEIQLIALCEEIKYPHAHQKGYRLVHEIFGELCDGNGIKPIAPILETYGLAQTGGWV